MSPQYSDIEELLNQRNDFRIRLELLTFSGEEAYEIRKSLHNIEKQLALLGYHENNLSADVIKSIDLAQVNM